jgi:hypothetical protein
MAAEGRQRSYFVKRTSFPARRRPLSILARGAASGNIREGRTRCMETASNGEL